MFNFFYNSWKNDDVDKHINQQLSGILIHINMKLLRNHENDKMGALHPLKLSSYIIGKTLLQSKEIERTKVVINEHGSS